MSSTKQSIRDFYDKHSEAIKIGTIVALGVVTGILCGKKAVACGLSCDKLIGIHKDTGLNFVKGDSGTYLAAIRTVDDLGALGDDILTVMSKADETVTKDTIVGVSVCRYGK